MRSLWKKELSKTSRALLCKIKVELLKFPVVFEEMNWGIEPKRGHFSRCRSNQICIYRDLRLVSEFEWHWFSKYKLTYINLFFHVGCLKNNNNYESHIRKQYLWEVSNSLEKGFRQSFTLSKTGKLVDKLTFSSSLTTRHLYRIILCTSSNLYVWNSGKWKKRYVKKCIFWQECGSWTETKLLTIT